MWGWRSSRTVVLSAAIAAFAFFCLVPLAFMIAIPLRDSSRTLAPYAALLLDARQRGLLYNTTILGLGTALTATFVGVPLGLALARVALPFKTGLRIALSAPLLLPSYVVGLAWISLGGGTGILTEGIGLQVPSEWIYSLAGATFVLTLVLYPLSMLATETAVRRVEPRLEEAALLVATPGRVLWRITLPLIAPSITAAALVVFVLAVSEFGVPALLRVRVFTTEVFTAFAALYDFGRATVLAMPLLLLATFVAVLATRLAGERLVVTRRGHVGGQPVAFAAWQRVAAGAAACVDLVALGLPLALLAREARGIDSWARVVQGARDAVVNSLTLAAYGATAVTAVAVWLGYARARAPRGLGIAADVLFVVLFAVPSTVVGIGVIQLWNRPGIAGALYGTNAMFVVVYLVRFVPVAALALAASLRRVPVSHEEAAAVSGAGWLRTMSHVVLPQIA
ncbi:MAG: iron ABC transporter permease, partial [Acidobacteria bacterium]|nr:iron ABC transporter permease [Acidobacteriota bacterium]